MRLRPVAVALSLTLAACGAAEEPEPAPIVEPGPDLEAARTELLMADRAWFDAYTLSEDPAQTFVDHMTDEARLLPPDAPLAAGKEAIHTTVSALEAMPGFSVQWAPTDAEVGGAADLGYTVGTYEMRFEQDGELVRVNGKYLTVWQKQDDGTWKVTADMFNADGPPAPIE